MNTNRLFLAIIVGGIAGALLALFFYMLGMRSPNAHEDHTASTEAFEQIQFENAEDVWEHLDLPPLEEQPRLPTMDDVDYKWQLAGFRKQAMLERAIWIAGLTDMVTGTNIVADYSEDDLLLEVAKTPGFNARYGVRFQPYLQAHQGALTVSEELIGDDQLDAYSALILIIALNHEYTHHLQWLESGKGFLWKDLTQAEACALHWGREHSAYSADRQLATSWGFLNLLGRPYTGTQEEFENQFRQTMERLHPECIALWL